MLNIILIRHGKTYGNTLGRYVGSGTDEPLCEEGICQLKKNRYPDAELIYVSPMVRCRETAGYLYPSIKAVCNELLKECDFGLFENKTYTELSGNPQYQAWIDSNGTLPFPQGEAAEDFRRRCSKGFCQCVEDAFQSNRKQVAMVVHGGTIMSILASFAVPKGEYFGWQIKNGEYYELILEKELWEKEHSISSVKKGQFFND